MRGTSAGVVERLFAAYQTSHQLTTIAAVTMRACADLEGQVPAAAQPKLLERLARTRLDALDSDQATIDPGLRQ